MTTTKEVTQEVWQNATNGSVAVIKYDRRGEAIHEMVAPRGRFSIRPEERLLNQDKAAQEELDVFMNGTLVPVRLIEDSEGAAEIASNPNLMTETEIGESLKGSVKNLQAKLEEVHNVVTLQRMLAVAEENDVTLSKMRAIQNRLEEVAPRNFVERAITVTDTAPSIPSLRSRTPKGAGMNPVQPK